MSAVDGVAVRDATAAERGAVRALTLAAYAEYAAIMDPAAWVGLDGALRAALDGGDAAAWIVAVRDDALLGSVLLFPPAADAYVGLAAPPPWPELRLLAVAPVARGRGIGERLVAECARRARAAGASALSLHTSRSMQPALRLYARLGFERAPALDFQPPGTELVEGYLLPLPPP